MALPDCHGLKRLEGRFMKRGDVKARLKGIRCLFDATASFGGDSIISREYTRGDRVEVAAWR